MKITLQITSKYRLSMASPYTKRTRLCPPTPEAKHQLFKVFELSPKTSGRDTSSCCRNKQQNSARSISRANSSTYLGSGKVQVKPIIMSQQDLHHNDHSHSSMNSSQAIREKNEHSELIFSKPQNNASSMGFEPNTLFAPPQNEKLHRKNSQGHYNNEKRCFRNQHPNRCLGVPYRKCHSSMQQKIVNIINKIKNQKQCHKEIETLLERAKKVSVKQLSNRYFISGLLVILRLVEQWKQTHGLISKIKAVIAQLRMRILEQLDSIKGFQLMLQPQSKPQLHKGVLIRKAYQVLHKKRQDCKKEVLQQKAIKFTCWFIEQQPSDLNLFWEELRKV